MIARASSSERLFWLALVCCIGLLCLAVNGVSLWIDEGFIAWAVDHRTPLDMASALVPPYIPSPADRQYPLYDLWMWLWVHGFGSSEYALRAANLPFAVIYVVSLALGSRFAFGGRFVWIPLALSPFVWYYMDEARPYLMLAALSTGVVSAASIYAFGSGIAKERAKHLVLPLFFLALASHILAVLLAPGLLAVVLLAGRPDVRKLWIDWRTTAFAWALPFAALVVFYGLTLTGGRVGAEVANNQHRGGSPIAYAGEALYEQVGLGGLGPPRSALRATRGYVDLKRFALSLFGGCIALASFVIVGLLRGANRRTAALFAAAFALSFGLALVASDVLHARFLGRHLAAIFPLLAFGLLALARTRIQIALLLAAFVVSDARLTLLPDYGKDDYRAAVSDVIGRQRAEGGSIAWAADDLTAGYYGLALQGGRLEHRAARVPWAVRGRGELASDPSFRTVSDSLRAQSRGGAPTFLALSRTDIFDTRQGWRTAIDRYHPATVARYREFTIYRFAPISRR